MPIYRTNGAWGSGIGVNLTPAQADGNFYELRTDLDDFIANPPVADSLVSVVQEGFNLTFLTTLGNELGPVTMPVVQFRWRGEWSPLTLYDAADMFKVTDEGIFTVMADHTSGATFDAVATGGSPAVPLYNQIIGVASLPADTALDDLNDVTITGVADDDLIAWDDGLSQWTNRTPSAVLALLAPTIDDLTDVIAPSPVAGQVLRYLGGSPDAGWQPDSFTLDDLADVSAAAPGNGYVLTYQAGSPTGWIAAAPAAVPSTLDSLTDVSAASPADGDFLQYDTGSPSGWKNQAGTAISSLGAATLPVNTASLLEISEATGSPVTYDSKRITIANLLARGDITLGSTAVALGATVTTIAGLTLSTPAFTGDITLPASGQINGTTGFFGVGGTPAAKLHIQGGVSAAAWTTSGIGLRVSGATYIDTSSSGTVADVSAHVLGIPTLAASSSTTFTKASSLTLLGAPAAGTNVTVTNPFTLNVAAGNANFGAALFVTGMAETSVFRAKGGTVTGATGPGLECSYSVGSDWGNVTAFDRTAVAYKPLRFDGLDLRFLVSGVEKAKAFVGGDFRQGTGSALATTATDGFLLIATCAGAPTGVPTNAGAGQIPLIFDKTNFQLYAYISGTGWKKSAVWT